MAAVRLPLRTDRLVLRGWVVGDMDDIHAYRGRDDVTRWLMFDAEPWERVAELVRERAGSTAVESDHDAVHLAHLREESWFRGGWGDLAIWALLVHERS